MPSRLLSSFVKAVILDPRSKTQKILRHAVSSVWHLPCSAGKVLYIYECAIEGDSIRHRERRAAVTSAGPGWAIPYSRLIQKLNEKGFTNGDVIVLKGSSR